MYISVGDEERRKELRREDKDGESSEQRKRGKDRRNRAGYEQSLTERMYVFTF